MTVTQNVYCSVLLVLDILVFWISALSIRKRRRSSKSFAFEQSKTVFFLSQILLCTSFVTFSYLITSPACFQSDAIASNGSSSNLVVRMLVRDTKALLNCIHALLFFGLTVWLYLHPQLFLTEIAYTMGLYMFTVSLVFVILQSIQLFTFGLSSLLLFIISVLQAFVFLFVLTSSSRYKRAQDDAENEAEGDTDNDELMQNGERSADADQQSLGNFSENSKRARASADNSEFSFLGRSEFGKSIHDPYAQSLRRVTMNWVGSEVKLFFLYNVVVLCLRVRLAREAEIGFAPFVEGYVQSYTTAIHKGVLVAFGFYGAKHMIAAPLLYYSFGNSVFALVSALSLAPTIVSSADDPFFLISLACIILQIVCMTGGLLSAMRLRKFLLDHAAGRPRSSAPVEGGSDPGYGILSIAKKITNANMRSQLRRIGTAVIGNVVLWQWEAITIACLPLLDVGVGESVRLSALAMNFAIHGAYIFVLQYFRTVDKDQKISSRKMWHMLLASVFSLLALNELISILAARTIPLLSIASFIFASRFLLCAWMVYSFFRLKSGREEAQKPRYENGEDSSIPTPKITSPPIPPLEVRRLQFYCDVLLKILFTAFMVFCGILLVRSPDYSGLIGTQFSIADIGWHSPAYSTAYHFCFLLIGVGYQGISLFNTRKLGTLISCSSSVGTVVAVNVSLLIWQFSSPKPTTQFEGFVFAALLGIACASVASCTCGLWLRSAIVRQGVVERVMVFNGRFR